MTGDRSEANGPAEPCQGPHPCPGCGTTIYAREICCSPCYLWLPPETKIGMWKMHELPEMLAETIRSAQGHLRARPRDLPGMAS